jgi:hypothetical protein
MLLALTFVAAPLFPHCDTLNGPVVAAARLALQQGDVTPVLKWIPPASESEVRGAFRQALAVRAKGAEARDVADRWFFETVVRLHRGGEGMAYTGLKSDMPEEVIARADAAIRKGSVDELANDLSKDVAAGVRLRFSRLMDASKSADQNVEAGRRYVAAYIDFTHYVEKIHQTGSDHEQQH